MLIAFVCLFVIFPGEDDSSSLEVCVSPAIMSLSCMKICNFLREQGEQGCFTALQGTEGDHRTGRAVSLAQSAVPLFQSSAAVMV